MNTLARSTSVVAFLLLLNSHVSAQGFQVESKGPQPAAAQTFTSLEGRFTIALPQQVSGFRPVTVETPKGRATLGDSYSWRLPGARYDVGYLDPAPSYTSDGRGLVNNIADGTIAEAAKKSGRLVSNSEIPLAGGYGREVRIEFPDAVLITRILFSGGRMFQLLAGVKKDAGAQESAVKVLDSFRILTAAEVEAARQKQAAEAEPRPLPQAPVAARPNSDAQDEGLRGRVKVVFTETEDLSGTWSVQKRKPSAREYYNEQGNLTRRESYDYKGNLDDVTVYGYLDGERASNDKFIRQEYNPPPMLVAPAPGGEKPKYDPRYHFKFRFKYDDQGHLAEKDWYSNDGRLWLRYVYSYKGGRKEELVYSEDGSLNQKYLYTLDDKGNETEEVVYETKDDSVRSKYSYTYEFDAQGNWVKRTTSKWATKGGEPHYEPYSVTYRTITYY